MQVENEWFFDYSLGTPQSLFDKSAQGEATILTSNYVMHGHTHTNRMSKEFIERVQTAWFYRTNFCWQEDIDNILGNIIINWFFHSLLKV